MELLNIIVATLVMTFVVGPCSAFHLSVVPVKVEIGAEASLHCACALLASYDVVRLVWIRILKKSAHAWTRLAEYREMDKCVLTHGEISGADVSVSAKMGAADRSYLTIRWRAATEQIYGTYRCDVIGVTENEDFRALSTAPLNISGVSGNGGAGNDQELRMIKSKMEELSIFVKTVQEKQLSISAEIGELRTILSSALLPGTKQAPQNETTNEFGANYVTRVAAHGTTLISGNHSMPPFYEKLTPPNGKGWPKGSYALLMPETGCPQSASDGWRDGFYVVQMDTDNLSPLGVNLTKTHAAKPLYELYENIHVINLLFCMMTNKQSGSDWPMGTYCIGRSGGQCPVGFSSGFMRLSEERNRAPLDMSEILPDVEVTPDGTRFHFCCRKDRNHSEPMRLPTSSQFFLYRHGGECQAVDGMTSSEESLTIDTENDGNTDAYENLHHPDGQVDDVIIRLCYYETKTKA